MLLLSGFYLVYKAFTSNESHLSFGIAVDDNPRLFKFLNFITGLLFIVVGLYYFLQEIK